MRPGRSEQDIARAVVAHLQRDGWTVYQEVATGASAPIADIVAVSGRVSWIIECKRSRTLVVVDQARAWIGAATWVSVAVPPARRSGSYRLRGYDTWEYVLEHFGVGLLEVLGNDASQKLAPQLCRKRLHSLRIEGFLCEEQRSGIYADAGASRGGYWTPFQSTCLALTRWARANDGGRLAVAVDSIRHHYANNRSARGSLARWIAQGKVSGIRYEAGRVYLEKETVT